ncbi:MAG: leucine-rich repeat domain-containing protein, partial [Prevotella sp.]
MKRLTTLLVMFITMLMTCSWAQAQTSSGSTADRVAVDGIAYKIDKTNKTATVIEDYYTDEDNNRQQLCDPYSGDIVIPTSIAVEGTQYAVTEIGNRAFCVRTINSITLPSSLKKIGDEAFGLTRGITSLTIPASVEEIGKTCFVFCYELKSIIVEEGNQHFCIEQGMLMTADKSRVLCLTGAYDEEETINIALPSTVRTIDDYAMCGCRALKSLTLPEGLEKIGGLAFENTDISSITIPSTVSDLGIGFLADTEKLNEISVSEANPFFKSVDGVLYNKDVSKLLKVSVGHTLLSIPKTVKYIDYGAITNTDLRTLVIPNNVEEVSKHAVHNNDNLKTIVIGSGVNNIGFLAFGGNDALKSIFSRNPEPVVLSEGIFMDYEHMSTTTLFVPEGAKQKYAAAENWNQFANIREYSLAGIDTYTGKASASSVVVDGIAYDLNKQDMTATVVNDSYGIGDEHVELCPFYSGDIVIPEEITVDGVTYPVTEVGEFSFAMRTVNSITLPSTLKKINRRAFCGVWKLRSLNIPASVEEIGAEAFTLNYDLEELNLDAANKHFVMEGNMLLSADKTRFLYLLGATDWNESIEVVIPSTVKTIDDSALYAAAAVTSLTLPEGLESIGTMAFGCISVSSIHIPSSVKSIGMSFMVFAENLKEITLGEGNTNFVLENGMLLSKDRTELLLMPCYHDNYIIPETVTNIKEEAASSLHATTLVIPDGVKTLSYQACAYSETLETVVIGSGVETWEAYVFYACDAIKSIYLRSEKVVTPGAMPFEEALFDTATLYVPAGTKGLYEGDPYWGQFKNIVEYQPTGIEGVNTNGSHSIESIYDLS